MAHAPSGRSRTAGDEANHRLLAAALSLVLEELRRVFLRGAADLADHDDRFRWLIGEEHFQHLDEVGAFDGIAADADRSGLAKTFLCSLKHRLVSQRAGPRHDADLARLENISRHDADLALTCRHHAGAVRSNQPRL